MELGMSHDKVHDSAEVEVRISRTKCGKVIDLVQMTMARTCQAGQRDVPLVLELLRKQPKEEAHHQQRYGYGMIWLRVENPSGQDIAWAQLHLLVDQLLDTWCPSSPSPCAWTQSNQRLCGWHRATRVCTHTMWRTFECGPQRGKINTCESTDIQGNKRHGY